MVNWFRISPENMFLNDTNKTNRNRGTEKLASKLRNSA